MNYGRIADPRMLIVQIGLLLKSNMAGLGPIIFVSQLFHLKQPCIQSFDLHNIKLVEGNDKVLRIK